MGGQQSLVVPNQLLGGQLAHALYKLAFNLPNVDGRVDAVAHGRQYVHFQHLAFTGEQVNGDFGAGRTLGEVVKRSAGQHGLVVMNFRRAEKAIAPQSGDDLANPGVQALAHFGVAVVDLAEIIKVHMHQRAGLVEQRGNKWQQTKC